MSTIFLKHSLNFKRYCDIVHTQIVSSDQLHTYTVSVPAWILDLNAKKNSVWVISPNIWRDQNQIHCLAANEIIYVHIWKRNSNQDHLNTILSWSRNRRRWLECFTDRPWSDVQSSPRFATSGYEQYNCAGKEACSVRDHTLWKTANRLSSAC